MSSVTSSPVWADATVCTHRPAHKPVSKKDNKTMSIAKQNTSGNLYRTSCMIELILEDLAKNYDGVGGGGISSIKAASSTSYIVSLPQEERIDLLTYEFAVKADGTVSLKSKVASTQSVEPKSSGAGPTKK
jgi:hypothetical protein